MAKLTKEQVLDDFKKIHGNKYDYSKVLYLKTNIPVTIICPDHGIFSQQPLHHKKGSGCPDCHDKGKHNTKSLKEHLKNVPEYQLELYEYQNIIYKNSKNYFKLKCKACNHIFEQIVYNHKNGSGCPKCATGKKSKGEKRIIKILEESNIEFEFQKTFKDCKNPNNSYYLYYDFYIPNKNLCIEFDGPQHFYPNKKFGGKDEFEKTQIRDKIKTKYCKQNGIRLLRIKYDENIEEKLKEVING